MLDERALDEFASVFEAAVKPKVEIQPVTWSRILVGLDGSERAEAGAAVARHLATRFKVPLRFVATRALLAGEDEAAIQAALDGWLEAALSVAKEAGIEADGVARLANPGDVLLEEMKAAPTSLTVLSTPHGGQTPDRATLGSVVDHVLTASDCPLLLIKGPVADPAATFTSILAYLPGGFEVGPHFSIPFALVEPEGNLELMHIIDSGEVHKYAAAFEITADADTEREKADSMIHGLEERMTALLEAAVSVVRQESFGCRSLVGCGNPIQSVALHLLNQRDSLLVVESESRPEQAISAEAYAMLKEISGVPILAL